MEGERGTGGNEWGTRGNITGREGTRGMRPWESIVRTNVASEELAHSLFHLKL